MKRLIYGFLSALFIFIFISNFGVKASVSAAQNKNTFSVNSASSNFAVTGNGTDCDVNWNPLSWVICPVMDLVSFALEGLYKSFILPLLKTQPIPLPGQVDPGNKLQIYSIWSNFRLIGNVLLIIVLLVIVFGESIGGGLIDAYSVKKILPRLLIGAVLINLSIYIVAFGLDVTNIIGGGLKGIIEAPFPKEVNVLTFDQNVGGLASGFGLALTAGVASAVALAVWGPMLIVMVFIPTVLVFAITVGLLMLRQGLIMLLVFIAPVAFALWCLPNTEQYFKKWWKTLFTTLLIFPIISVLFALGNIVSYTVGSVMGDNVRPIVQVIGYIAPFYLMPFSFQFAGGILATAAGLASSRINKPAMGRLGQARQNTAKQRVPRSKLLNGNLQRFGAAGKGINGAVTGAKAFTSGRGVKGRMASGRVRQEALRDARAEELAKTAEFVKASKNEKAVTVLAASGGTRQGAKSFIEEQRRKGKINASNEKQWEEAFDTASAVGFDSVSHRAASDEAFATGAKGLLGSDNGNLGMSASDANKVLEASAAKASPFDNGAAVIGTGKFKAKTGPRPDLSYGTDYKAAVAEQGVKILTSDRAYATSLVDHFGAIARDFSHPEQEEALRILQQLDSQAATTPGISGETYAALRRQIDGA